jgi:acyl-CoA reductase-like NAD-dependent aldehyde dehydrogenase/choline dehydrogenase-like flavoprotein
MATAQREAAATGAGGGIPVENPATGEVLATVPDLGAEQVEAMVAASRQAQPGWEAMGADGRAEILLAARRWMVANGERVVQTISGETGRPADESQFAELSYGLSALEFWAKRGGEYLADEEVESASAFVRGRKLKIRYAPVGVVGVIGPWNFPLNNSFGDCIPALMAGNAVVLKPSEVTPLTSLLMAEMLGEVGLPEGVFQVATGRGETGAALVDLVDFVMFTGSVATGKKVMAKAAETLTPVSLELGGKDPMIVLADADLERATNAAIAYGLNNSGQVCISVERIYVEEPVHDEFVELLTQKVAALRQGPPGPLGSVDVGAIIFEPQLGIIESHVADAVDKGAEVRTGGKRGAGPGRFYEPTVLTNVDHSMRCMTEETFGPTLPVMKVADSEEAIRLANDGPYGLQASVWTRDHERGEELARRIDAGVSSVNDTQLNYAAMELPMGGWKSSGLGSRHGPGGIRKYTKTQSLMITPGYAPPRELHYFPYNAQVSQQIGEFAAFMATSTVFDDAQRMTLRAFCDTIAPSQDPPEGTTAIAEVGFWRRSASDMSVPEAIEQAVSNLPEENQVGLAGLLDSLAENGLAPSAPQELRETILKGFEEAGPDALAGIQTLRSLTLTLFYALPDLGTGKNPNWEAMGYSGPRALPRDEPKSLTVRAPDSDLLTLEADVCVVGSGCGGSVIAAELAGRGKQVAIVESGGYFNESDFNGYELWAYQNLYLNGGPFPTAEGQVSILAGGTLGGGSVVNWTNCLRTYPWVREEWARDHGLEGLDGADYDGHLDAVFHRLGVTDQCSDLNGVHEALRRGCEKLGYDFRTITRNAIGEMYDPELAGFMGFGDVSGAKASTQKNYLPDAQLAGAQIVARCRIERVLTENGRAAGVEGTYVAEDGTTARVEVRAPTIVVAGGSIESPALLLRSRIGGPAVGDYLRLHPSTAVSGLYDHDTRAWFGPPQAALSHEFEDVEDGYGFLVECSQHTTGLFGAATQWRSGREHKERMLEWNRVGAFIFLIRDRGHGRVTIDRDGNPVVSYVMNDELDQHVFRRGLSELIRLQEAAGAEEIVTLARGASEWSRGDDLDKFIAEIASASLEPRQHAIFSAHQMGSCRMGSDPKTSVANPWGELHDTPGVWIGDASAFPTASGTNPMATVMALARRTAHAIAAS